jgi:hypothetical protein
MKRALVTVPAVPDMAMMYTGRDTLLFQMVLEAAPLIASH